MKPGETQASLPPRDQPPAAWVPRPEEFQRPQPWAAPPRARGPGARSKFAGLCLILAGIIGIATTFWAYSTPLTPEEQQSIENITRENPGLANALLALTIISLYAQSVAVLGGVLAFQGKDWKLVVVCAAFSILTLGFSFLGTVFGFLALILVISSRHEFIS